MRELVAGTDVARLATVRPDGRPHLVPITFAFQGERIVTAVDRKPKSTRDLQRLANIRHDPRVSVLVDHYQEDWSGLWWVRIDGDAEIVEDPADAPTALEALVERYRQYHEDPPEGPLVVIRPTGWRGWSASP